MSNFSPGPSGALQVKFVVRSLAVGGAERQVVSLAKGLASRGHGVTLIVLSDDLSMAEPLIGTSVRLVSLNKQSRWHVGGWLKGLFHEVRRAQDGIVCAWMPAEALITYSVSRLIGSAPFLWSIRTSDINLSQYDVLTGIVFRLHRQLVRLGFGEGAVFNSYAGVRAYGLTLDDKRLAVIWNSVDLDQFRPNAELRAEGRKVLEVGHDQPLVVSVGRLHPTKDHISFVNAARLIAAELPEAKFAIIGAGAVAERTNIARSISEAGISSQFHLVGARSDIPAILNAADVVVSTSKAGEGVQNSVVEAMSCGRPVVATDVGDSSLVLSPWDSLVPVGDYRRVASEVLQQLRDDRGSRSAERVAHAAKLFAPERACLEMESLMLRIVDRDPVRSHQGQDNC